MEYVFILPGICFKDWMKPCRYSECTQASGSELLQADLSSCEAPVLFACAPLLGVPAPGRQSSKGSPRVVSCALGTETVLCREKAAWEVRRSAEAVMVTLVQETNQSQGLDMPSAFPPSAWRFYISIC